MKYKRFLSLLLAVVMLFSMTALAAEPHATGTNAAVDGSASSVVTVDAEPVQMTVTVPAILPATVDAQGTVLVATDAKVINHSYGPVAVTAIRAEAVAPWSLAAGDFDFAAAKVGSKQVSLSIDDQKANAAGQVTIPEGQWVIAGGDVERPFSYGVRIPAQKTAITAEPVKAVFTVDWDLAEGATEVPLEGLTISGPTTVSVSENITLTAAKVPSNTTDENTVTWSSSNDNIATVNNDGVVAGVANGSVTITATCGTVTSTWAVEVTVPGPLYADHAILYSDGTMVFQHGSEADASHGAVVGNYTGFDTNTYTYESRAPWNDKRSSITTVEFSDTTKPVSTAYWFANCTNLASINGIEKLNTSNVTDMSYMFHFCETLTSLDLSNFNTSKVTNMASMFNYCHTLTSLDLSSFDTSNVTDMFCMFLACHNVTSLNVNSFDTSKVTNMAGMFGCRNLTTLDVSGFDTSNTTNMMQMFSNCQSLTSLDVSGFDTSNVTNMKDMFDMCVSLTSLNVSGFDTKKVTNMEAMFKQCYALTSLDLSGFDTSNVTNMSYMFYGCRAFTSLDLSSFNTNKVTNMSYMFDESDALTTLTLSSNFAFKGTDHGLRNVAWYDAVTGTQYTATTIPSNKAATYTTVQPV